MATIMWLFFYIKYLHLALQYHLPYVNISVDILSPLSTIKNYKNTRKRGDNMTDMISSRHDEYMKCISELRLIDDDFMRVVFKDKECVKYILREVLQEDYYDIIDSQTEYDLKNLHGRSNVIDILAVDIKGRHINIEFQKYKKGASPRRARRHASMVDVNMSREKEELDQIKDMKVIFFTEKDELGNGLPISHIHRYIEETEEKIEDGTEIIYIPVNIRDGSTLDLLKEDLLAKEAAKIHSKILRERVKYFKESQEGQREMCKIFEEIREHGYIDGKHHGIEEGKELVIKMMLSEGESIEKIMKYTGTTIDKITHIRNSMIYA